MLHGEIEITKKKTQQKWQKSNSKAHEFCFNDDKGPVAISIFGNNDPFELSGWYSFH